MYYAYRGSPKHEVSQATVCTAAKISHQSSILPPNHPQQPSSASGPPILQRPWIYSPPLRRRRRRRSRSRSRSRRRSRRATAASQPQRKHADSAFPPRCSEYMAAAEKAGRERRRYQTQSQTDVRLGSCAQPTPTSDPSRVVRSPGVFVELQTVSW